LLSDVSLVLADWNFARVEHSFNSMSSAHAVGERSNFLTLEAFPIDYIQALLHYSEELGGVVESLIIGHEYLVQLATSIR